jgi:predicted DNA-binding transcriptional regulator YafY
MEALRTLDTHRHGATADDLAAELAVTKRTIWRDLQALQDVGSRSRATKMASARAGRC